MAKVATKHLLCMQYSTGVLAERGIADFLAGPSDLFPSLRTALPAIREERARHVDTHVIAAADLPDAARRPARRPRGKAGAAVHAARALLRNLRAPHDDSYHRPDIAVAEHDARWWALGAVDSAAVSVSTGTQFRRRDPPPSASSSYT